MVRKKSELSSNSTIDNLLPPVPSVPQILADNLKYEQELKKQAKLHAKNRKKRKGSHTSTKYLPDWVNDLQCDWAHSHDFRNYSKNKRPPYQARPHSKSPKRAHNRNISDMSLVSNHSDNNNNNNNNNNHHNIEIKTDLEIIDIDTKTGQKHSKLTPYTSKTSPVFESPAQSPDICHTDDELTDLNTLSIIHTRARSTSKESACSDYALNNEFDPIHLQARLSNSRSKSLPSDIKNDLSHQVSQHLEKFNDENQHQKNSMLPSELKKKYKTKIKEIGDINIPCTEKKNSGKLSHKLLRKRRQKKNKNKSEVEAKVIDEEHEINNNYFATPTREEYSSSPSCEDKNINMKPSVEKATLTKKVTRSSGMFSRLLSKIHTWTDKNRQAFTSYLQLLKTAINKQESLIKQYQSELHNCRKQMSSELKRWKRWAQIEAENMARTYYENKYLLLSSQIEIAMAKLHILQDIGSNVQFVLDGGDMEKVKHIIFEAENNNNKFLSSPTTTPSVSEKRMNNSYSKLPAITTPVSDDEMEQNNNKHNHNNHNAVYMFKNPNVLALEVNIAVLQEVLPTLIDVESKLRIQYESLIAKIMVQQSVSERGNIYRKIILCGYECKYLIRSQNYHYHPPDDKGLQVEFNCLLIDDRYCEGKLLRKWRKDIQKTRKVGAPDVSDFLQEVTTLILREYPVYQRDDWDPNRLDDKDVTCLKDIELMHKYGMKYVDTYYVLKLYLDRLVFPRLSFANSNGSSGNGVDGDNKIPIWISLYGEEEREFDIEFAANCEWMRNLTQSQISISLEYQKRFVRHNKDIQSQFNSRFAIKNNMIHPELPYYEAILSFNKAQNVYVPNDMLYCFIEGLRLINSNASQYKYKNDVIDYYLNMNNENELNTIDEVKQFDNDDAVVKKENVQLCADDLFPILVWIIVHCRINDIYMRLGYLQKFLDDSIKYFGEVGMCLSLVQAAAEFIRKKEGWHFGLDQELDKNTLNTFGNNSKQNQNLVNNEENDNNDDSDTNTLISNNDNNKNNNDNNDKEETEI